MALVCEICGKSKSIGSSQKHRRGVAGKRWKKRVAKTPRTFKPNLQKKTLTINGEKKKMTVCAKCLKRIKKYGSIKNYSKVTIG
jgi:large subunit ribosomal protein L28